MISSCLSSGCFFFSFHLLIFTYSPPFFSGNESPLFIAILSDFFRNWQKNRRLTFYKSNDIFIPIKAFTFLAVHFLAASAASNIQTGSVRRNLNALYPNQTTQRGFEEDGCLLRTFHFKGGNWMEKKPNRLYKARLFVMIFEDKRKLLELYNAISGKHYEDPEFLEINTLENAIYMSMKNDLSFLIDARLSLYEHQSTYSPNLPLRFLFYL